MSATPLPWPPFRIGLISREDYELARERVNAHPGLVELLAEALEIDIQGSPHWSGKRAALELQQRIREQLAELGYSTEPSRACAHCGQEPFGDGFEEGGKLFCGKDCADTSWKESRGD